MEVMADPIGSDAKVFKDLCTRFYSKSEQLEEELVHWPEWIANKQPPLGNHMGDDGMLPH